MEELQAELERYKKAEEEGRLLWIPFVEGDIVYFIKAAGQETSTSTQ